MEEFLFLSCLEYQVLQKHKINLEKNYKVQIQMPEKNKNDISSTDEIMCVNVVGDSKSIDCVKDFLKKNHNDERQMDSTIILSSDSENENSENVNCVNRIKKLKRKKANLANPEVGISSSSVTKKVDSSCKAKGNENSDVSVIVLETITKEDSVIPIFQSGCSDISSNKRDSVIILEPPLPTEDFIPLFSSGRNRQRKRKYKEQFSAKNESNAVTDVIEILSDEETESIPPAPRQLRPIAIDGSNVARAHGKPTNTYSCKGIKICVDYFLERGHTTVMAFVPNFRRHVNKGPVITEDPQILEELEKNRNLAFTPSRRVNGKLYTCYDDRFVVQFASSCGGVIVSNDNFKDLLEEDESFKETIEKRLLMFCFVGDKIMIPQDPLGKDGPKLSEFLSFPASPD